MKTVAIVAATLLMMWFVDTFPNITAGIIGLGVLVGFVALFRKVWNL
jgi:L-lactate permease